MDTKTARIRALNDELRQHLTGVMAVITSGVAALGPEAVERIVKTIAVFDDFCHANDPYEEHDFGSFAADGHMIYFKIDYCSIRACRCTRPIHPSPSGLSRSCWLRSIRDPAAVGLSFARCAKIDRRSSRLTDCSTMAKA
jgi:hypothetical protein